MIYFSLFFVDMIHLFLNFKMPLWVFILAMVGFSAIRYQIDWFFLLKAVKISGLLTGGTILEATLKKF